MEEDGPSNYSGGPPEQTPAGTSTAERRGVNRHPFSEAAEVIEVASGVRFSGRTTDLGLGGCFVDTIVPFSTGAKVHVRICKGEEKLETDGKVAYSQAGLGMGIAFDALNAEQVEVLDAWLVELTGRQHASAEGGSGPKLGTVAANRATFVRLVLLLLTKGVVTESEALSVLYDHDPTL